MSDLSHPKVTAEILLPGSTSRPGASTTGSGWWCPTPLPFPDGVRYWPDLPPGATTGDRDKAFDALEAANEALIRSRTLDDWLRKGEVRVPGGATTPIAYSCTDFALSSAPTRPGLLTVATVDLSTDSLKGRTAVLAEPGTVYASKDTLYVATNHWWWWPEIGQTDATYVHAFDLRVSGLGAVRRLGDGGRDGA